MSTTPLIVLVGQAIRARRTATGLSQDRVADKLGMHRAYYAAIERGEKNVTLLTIKRVADGLEVNISDLLRDAGY